MVVEDPRVEEQVKAFTWRTASIVPLEALRAKIVRSLQEKRPLRVKLGIDPTAADLHLGHVVVLDKLRDFQRYGHEVYLLIGDFTARVGDPTGRASMRKSLEESEIKEYAQTYADQALRILDPTLTKIVYNSTWLGRLQLEDIVRLTAQTTVARMLEREDFATRYQTNKPIGLHEFLYPLLQGYDSVAMEADVELGGTDQTFNLAMGRQLQRLYGLEEQVMITLPLLVGLDGERKMSKSLGNQIGITEDPASMYGKVMSIPDTSMLDYYRWATDSTPESLRQLEQALQGGTLHPREAKGQLASQVVERYHDAAAAEQAAAAFRRAFQEQKVPTEVQEVAVPEQSYTIVDLLVSTGLTASRSEARRQLGQGSVRIDGVRCTEEHLQHDFPTGTVLQVGKRRFAKIKKTPPQEGGSH